MSYRNQKMFSLTILICLHTSLLNVDHRQLQLRSPISHNSIHLSFEVFQSLLQSHAILGINFRSAQFTYSHVTLLRGPDANNWITFLYKFRACVVKNTMLPFNRLNIDILIIYKVSFIQKMFFHIFLT